jgi:hypothetical protein
MGFSLVRICLLNQLLKNATTHTRRAVINKEQF